MTPATYALVGLGYWGPKLLRNLVDVVGPENVIAVDDVPTRVAAACAQHNGLRGRRSLEEALEDGVDAVILATPLRSHGPLGRLALDAGCHLLVEKPLAASVEEGLDLVGRAERGGLTLMVGHTFLFSPRVDMVADQVRADRLGNIKYVTCNRLNLGLHRQDANVIWDLAPHEFSILFRVLDEFPAVVQTLTPSHVAADRPEVAFINVAFPSGAIASITLSWLAPRKVRSMTFVGDQRMLIYDDDAADEPIKIFDKGRIRPDGASFASHQMTYRYGDTVAPYVPVTEPLRRELEHFVECTTKGVPCQSDGWFGVAVVETLEAADRSWQLGGLPISLSDPVGPRHFTVPQPAAVVLPVSAQMHE
jgi:predicted dehydrogenase